ncbi:MAG: hypothetical protein IJ679_03245, partial [Lachnospiraceae bacterium]|nr:hypothetical protein [Lachnospiraceae bacterium]
MPRIHYLYGKFQKTVVLFLTAVFLWIGIGSLKELAAVRLIDASYDGFSLFLGLFASALLLLLFRVGFLWIDREPSMRRQYGIAAFL